MARLLFIIVFFIVGMVAFKYIRRKIDEHSDKLNQEKLEQPKKTEAKDILKCQHCDLHVPKHEAIRQGDRVFCSLEHAKKHLE